MHHAALDADRQDELESKRGQLHGYLLYHFDAAEAYFVGGAPSTLDEGKNTYRAPASARDVAL